MEFSAPMLVRSKTILRIKLSPRKAGDSRSRGLIDSAVDSLTSGSLQVSAGASNTFGLAQQALVRPQNPESAVGRHSMLVIRVAESNSDTIAKRLETLTESAAPAHDAGRQPAMAATQRHLGSPCIIRVLERTAPGAHSAKIPFNTKPSRNDFNFGEFDPRTALPTRMRLWNDTVPGRVRNIHRFDAGQHLQHRNLFFSRDLSSA